MECEVCAPSYVLTSGTHLCVHRQLFQATDIKIPDTQEHTCTLILGLVKYIHVRNDVLNERGLVDITKLRPIGRAGDISFVRTGDAFRAPRPVWAEEEEKIRAVLEQ